MAVGTDPPHDALFSEDRLSFIDHFPSAIRSSSLPDYITVHLPSVMENDELQIFQSSIGSKGIHAYWVTKYCIRSTPGVEAAIRALDKFVLAHPEMASLSFSVRCSFTEDAEGRNGSTLFARISMEIYRDVSFLSDQVHTYCTRSKLLYTQN